jgi:hypothetical protein
MSELNYRVWRNKRGFGGINGTDGGIKTEFGGISSRFGGIPAQFGGISFRIYRVIPDFTNFLSYTPYHSLLNMEKKKNCTPLEKALE